MSAEFCAVIGVGAAGLDLGWRAYASLRRGMADLGNSLRQEIGGLGQEITEIKERLARVESTLALLLRGLHIEIRGEGNDTVGEPTHEARI